MRFFLDSVKLKLQHFVPQLDANFYVFQDGHSTKFLVISRFSNISPGPENR